MTTNHILSAAANSLLLPDSYRAIPDKPKPDYQWQELKRSLENLHNPFSRLLLLLLIIWFAAPGWLHLLDETAAGVDQSIWLLVTLSLISFLLLLSCCLWLLQFAWERLGLPQPNQLILQFKNLSSWQQIGLYWASFALLLFIASLCLIAIC